MSDSHLSIFPQRSPVRWCPDGRRRLVVVIDTEEEFDWLSPFDRGATAVTSMPAQASAQALFARLGIVPTYALTWPVLSSPDAVAYLREQVASGACEIGAHLHPWVTPPYLEPVDDRHSYAGNLPPSLERAKLTALTNRIGEVFGAAPRLYKAGRYGLGPTTAAILADLGYRIDASALPHFDLRPQQGPDYRGLTAEPFWFGPGGSLLELPMTVAIAGWLGHREDIYHRLGEGTYGRMRALGAMARSGLMERITLTPEGESHAAHRRLVRTLLARDQKLFCCTYHSPSLAPGHTPYVRSPADLTGFLDRLERTLHHLVHEQAVVPTTPKALLAELDLARGGGPLSRAGDGGAEGRRESVG